MISVGRATLPAMNDRLITSGRGVAGAWPPPDVDIVVPVHNEERIVEGSVWRLHRHLRESFPFSARITVADSASSDATREIALVLAAELEGVRVVQLEEKGRGRALRAAWSLSDARVLAYIDADLSTHLPALRPLVAPLLSGHADLAVGCASTRCRSTGRRTRTRACT